MFKGRCASPPHSSVERVAAVYSAIKTERAIRQARSTTIHKHSLRSNNPDSTRALDCGHKKDAAENSAGREQDKGSTDRSTCTQDRSHCDKMQGKVCNLALCYSHQDELHPAELQRNSASVLIDRRRKSARFVLLHLLSEAERTPREPLRADYGVEEQTDQQRQLRSALSAHRNGETTEETDRCTAGSRREVITSHQTEWAADDARLEAKQRAPFGRRRGSALLSARETDPLVRDAPMSTCQTRRLVRTDPRNGAKTHRKRPRRVSVEDN